MTELNLNSTSPGVRLSQFSLMNGLALTSWKLWSTRELSEGVPLCVSRTDVRGYTLSLGNDIAGIAGLNDADTRAAISSLSRSEGQERGDRGKRQQLLGEEHVSVVSMGVVIVLEYSCGERKAIACSYSRSVAAA